MTASEFVNLTIHVAPFLYIFYQVVIFTRQIQLKLHVFTIDYKRTWKWCLCQIWPKLWYNAQSTLMQPLYHAAFVHHNGQKQQKS